MPVAIVAVDNRGNVKLLNAQAERLFGYGAEELLGFTVDVLVPERFRAAHPGLRAGYLSAPISRPMGTGRDLYGLRKDGSEVPIEIGLNPISTPQGDFVLASIIDITERKRAEELRLLHAGMQQHNAELEALNKELESFSYSVSHDLRAPVRAVLGYARVIEEDYGPLLDDEGRRLLSVVHDEASRMGNLIDGLLAFSRLGRQPMQQTSIDMTALAREVAEEQVQLASRDTLVVDIQDLPFVRGDRMLLRQVWENLISNAIKYASKQAVIEVSIRGTLEAGRCVYHVQDNGVGFDMKYASKLFGVFQRLHRDDQFTGTGVGLAIVKRIVNRHGGSVWADAALGSGATFSFALPTQRAS
jgi:PAS domain S-box-containing protein